MKTETRIPIDTYLHAVYRPDCDYVDGEVLERNWGDLNHSELQSEFAHYFRARRREWNVYILVEQRVQVSPTRFRIPDVCVMVGKKPDEQIFRKPPFICIEVLSPEDRLSRVQQRVDDYLKFGVANVWVIDPETRRAWVHTKDGIFEAKDGILKTENPDLAVPLSEIFAGLDE